DISDIKEELININTNLAYLLQSEQYNRRPVQEFDLPITTAEELANMEVRLKTDESAFRDLVTTLALLNVGNVKRSVLNMMKRLLNKDMSLKYSCFGKKNKLNFSSLRISQAVFDAVRVKFPRSMEIEITRAISSCLVNAADRDGGRKLR
ncbi:hypothetical protein AMK59_2325, partial [Oryctes borbonicus]